MLQLTEKDQALVDAILKKHIPRRHVVVFGSRTTPMVKPHSDLDLCILGKTPLSLYQLAQLRDAFAESALPMRVDIVDWAVATPEFKNIIKQNAFKLR